MLLLALASLSASAACPNDSLQTAAETVLISMRSQNYDCVRQIIQNPELKFPGGRIDDAVLESLAWRSKGRRSYNDIVGDGKIFVDVVNGKNHSSVFYVPEKYRADYFKNKTSFKMNYYMNKYFVCNFVKTGASWELTEDFCFTESD